jgi:hypothetical protein
MGTRDQCALKGTLLKAVLRIRLHVFGHAGSGSFSTTDGSGSGSFNHQAKTVRKTLIPTVCVLRLLYDFFSLKNYVNIAVKSNKPKKI